ncbi:MAG: polysaccharide deacetylase family protein [Chloroflexota bacterium]
MEIRSMNKATGKAVFVFSLDLELLWGFIVSQNPVSSLLQSNLERTRGTIDLLLKLFERYDIKATWATVGHFFLDPGEDSGIVSDQLPQFREGWLDWNRYQGLRDNPLYWGKDIVEKIMANSVDHEIGLHGFFHMPFTECSREVAQAELELGVRAASRLGIKPTSFVFPQNKIAHIDLLKENGIEIHRGKNLRWWNTGIWPPVRKFDSGVHKVIAASTYPAYRDGVWELPGSTYFCDPQMPFSLPWRARLGLHRAIRDKKVFHIWLHPWSLLLYDRLAKDLEEFLALVARKRDEGKIEVMAMGELATMLNQKGIGS